MKLSLPVLAVGLTLASSSLQGAGIDWNSTPFDTTPLLNSSGALLDATFAFELGTFANAFIPTIDNFNLWESNWKLLSLAEAPDDWLPGLPSFGQTFTFNSNGTVTGLPGSATFTGGEQAYIWARGGVEWALVTDSSGSDKWALPSPGDFSPVSQLSWELSTADTVVVGGVNGIHSGTSYLSDNGGSFQLQTALIPEPQSCLLVMLAGMLATFARHRKPGLGQPW